MRCECISACDEYATDGPVKRFNFELAVDPKEVEMITGATIHTKAGMPVKLTKR